MLEAIISTGHNNLDDINIGSTGMLSKLNSSIPVGNESTKSIGIRRS
jgi:hypothetical protein